MNNDFADAMARATAAVRASNPMDATRIITEALGGKTTPEPRRTPRFDPDAETVEPIPAGQVPPDHAGAPLERFARRLRRPLREVIRTLRDGRRAAGYSPNPLEFPQPLTEPVPAPPVPEGAVFEDRHFTCPAGARSYKLYRPATAQFHGIVLMLHGCKQNPDDFATGTRMNEIAETHGLVIVYPRQTNADNLTACWNWFRPGDQRRDLGEPAILAGITRQILAEFNLEPGQAFAAGLSAGGAMAAVMAETYPDLFGAIGIHSGIPAGAANDVISAFAAMRGDALPLSQAVAPSVRSIVFHGDADRTVNPSNAARILTTTPGQRRAETGQTGGRRYVRTVIEAGARETEIWMIEGAGHAWSGGNAAGSCTDPAGPDASAEMARFFLARA